jgi:SAM-dependent methyltransferase
MSAAAVQTVEPYAVLAGVYDRAVGLAHFPWIRTSFEEARRAFGIRFDSAADIGCGTGLFARYLAASGVPVYAVDRSEAMLRMARRRTRGLPVTLLRQDIRQLRLPRPVGLITCNHDTLNYLLEDSDILRVFEGCRDNLVPGGFFLFDIVTRPAVFVKGREADGGARIMHRDLASTWQASFEPSSSRAQVRIEFSGNNLRRRREIHTQRWFGVCEISRLLRTGKLIVRGIHDVEDGGQPHPASRWVKFTVQTLTNQKTGV